MNVVMNFKGFGFSFIDNKPEELLYICMERLLMRYESSTSENPAKGEKKFNTIVDMRLYNFQIDNLISDKLPVLMGPKKYFKSKLVVAEDMANKQQSLADFCMIIDK